MVPRRTKRFLTRRWMWTVTPALAISIILIWILLQLFLPIQHLPKRSANSDSPFCIIPEIPLRSEAYNLTVNSVPRISLCNEKNGTMTSLLENGTLELRSDAYRREECTAFEILRPAKLSSDAHELRQLEPFDAMNQIPSITAEYVMVACLDRWTQSLEYSYHARTLSHQEPVKSKVEHWTEDPGQQLPLNVVLLVLDSTSAADASRHLPMTMEFLQKLNFVQFHKFHALGEPTMLNILPLLTGTSADETFERREWTDRWDGNYFIWQDFQNAHYVTSFIEDVPYVGTFNYGLQTGFLAPPTDIYPRPLFTAWELNKKENDKCIGDSSLWKFIFDYELNILRHFAGIAPVFSVPWLVWPFHDHFGTLSVLDVDMLNFFVNLSSSPSILENTLFIVMADHGFYNHGYSKTHEGLLERRLPLFLMRVPKKLDELLPNVSSIVAQNSERVVSHVDVYKTLFQLSQMAAVTEANGKWTRSDDEEGPGRSLFEPIPAGRTCREAHIPDGWCACNLPEPPPSPQTVIPNTVLLDVIPFHLLRIREWLGVE